MEIDFEHLMERYFDECEVVNLNDIPDFTSKKAYLHNTLNETYLLIWNYEISINNNSISLRDVIDNNVTINHPNFTQLEEKIYQSGKQIIMDVPAVMYGVMYDLKVVIVKVIFPCQLVISSKIFNVYRLIDYTYSICKKSNMIHLIQLPEYYLLKVINYQNPIRVISDTEIKFDRDWDGNHISLAKHNMCDIDETFKGLILINMYCYKTTNYLFGYSIPLIPN